MRKILLIAASVLLVLFIAPTLPAFADNGPHGGYTPTTDACAGCHRAHTASAGSLLIDTVPSLCYSCHGSAAPGANTDVVNGIDDSATLSLRGGGFQFVTMNPEQDVTGSTVQTLPVTSAHIEDGSTGTVWGFGAISAVADAGASGAPLTCTNCHNPHGGAGTGGSATYRILKGGGANTPLFDNGTVSQVSFVDVPDEATKQYTTSWNGLYFGDHGSNIGGVAVNAVLTAWCAQCHTRYHAPYPATPGSTDSGDAVYAFRHVTNDTTTDGCSSCHPNITDYYPGCVSCHVAHGTGARMGTYSGDTDWPDGSSLPSGNDRSSLLRLDNRGVCWQCHVDRSIAFP